MKKILNILLILYCMTFLSGCLNSKIETNPDSMTEINLGFLSESDSIEELIKIDDNNYIVVVRGDFEKERFSYTLYKYNINQGVFENSLHFNTFIDLIGVDSKNKEVMFVLNTYFTEENDTNEIVRINYEDMTIVERGLEDSANSRFIVSNDGKLMAYRGKDGLYLRTDKEDIFLLSHSINNDDIELSKAFFPIKFADNRLLYGQVGYEWTEGYGIIGIDGLDNHYANLMDMSYLGYDLAKNELYYTEEYEPQNVMKINMNDKEIEKVFELTSEEEYQASNRNIYLSEDFKFALIAEYFMQDDDMFKYKLEVINLKNGKLVAIYEFEPERYLDVRNYFFNNKSIVFTKDNKLMIWNY